MMYQPGKDEAELTPWSKPRVFAMGFGMVVFYSQQKIRGLNYTSKDDLVGKTGKTMVLVKWNAHVRWQKQWLWYSPILRKHPFDYPKHVWFHSKYDQNSKNKP